MEKGADLDIHAGIGYLDANCLENGLLLVGPILRW